jgi:hypothetical protein
VDFAPGADLSEGVKITIGSGKYSSGWLSFVTGEGQYFGDGDATNEMKSRPRGMQSDNRKSTMGSSKGLDDVLRDWEFDPHALTVRLFKGTDGRDVIQMRIDLGVLQMETQGRPDGQTCGSYPTLLDQLLAVEEKSPEFVMDDDQCFEADREFLQYYHRRISWLKLMHYHRAVEDADHTLALMDVCRDHSPDEEWTLSHEQYRPFVMFHRTQAAAMAALDEADAEKAIAVLEDGLEQIRDMFIEHEAEEEFENDEMVIQLVKLRDSLREEYGIGPSLQQQLDQAVKSEQYELAAQLRDQLARRQHP